MEPYFKKIFLLPLLMSLGIGLCINNGIAVLEALAGYKSSFLRTPKFQIENKTDTWKHKKYKGYAGNINMVLELTLGIYFLCAILFALQFNVYAAIPFLTLFCFGFFYVSLSSFYETHVSGRRQTALVILVLSLVNLLIGVDRSYGQTRADPVNKVVVYQMYHEYRKKFPDLKDISPREAMSLIKKEKVLFIDARSTAEMAVSMLSNAVSAEVFENNVKSNPKQYDNQTLITYCTIGYRSGLLAKKMAQQNITLYNLRGGILAWVFEGGSVFDKNGKNRRLHVYGSKWNYPPEGYETVW